jgi:regulatory protein
MTIVSIKTGTGGELRRIELSDGSLFSFKTCYLPPVFIDESLYTPGTAEGRDLKTDEEKAFRFASSCLRAEKAALQLVARAEQNFFGLSRKLEKRGHDSACVRSVIAHLSELELVDDRRYARLWLESRLSRLSGSPRRLLVALRGRGIDRDDAESALKSCLNPEIEEKLLKHYVEKHGLAEKNTTSSEAQASSEFSASSEARRGALSLKYLLKNEGFSYSAVQSYLEEQE